MQKVGEIAMTVFATVIEVGHGKGIKVKLDGEKEPRGTYYNSYVNVTPGDRVGMKHVSGTLIVEGKLLY
ncbi:MAG: hypothetical protein AB9856_14495 [Cellulosilyticaceae bacterium]